MYLKTHELFISGSFHLRFSGWLWVTENSKVKLQIRGILWKRKILHIKINSYLLVINKMLKSNTYMLYILIYRLYNITLTLTHIIFKS